MKAGKQQQQPARSADTPVSDTGPQKQKTEDNADKRRPWRMQKKKKQRFRWCMCAVVCDQVCECFSVAENTMSGRKTQWNWHTDSLVSHTYTHTHTQKKKQGNREWKKKKKGTVRKNREEKKKENRENAATRSLYATRTVLVLSRPRYSFFVVVVVVYMYWSIGFVNAHTNTHTHSWEKVMDDDETQK